MFDWRKKVLGDTIKSDKEVQQEHEILELKAKAAESSTYCKGNELYCQAVAEYEKDKVGYMFECSRFGQWLQVSIARLNNTPKVSRYGYDTVYSASLNLDQVKTIRLVIGYVPDRNGTLRYTHSTMIVDGARVTTVEPDYPRIPRGRPLFHLEPKSDPSLHNYYAGYEYRIKYITENFTRLAEDDQILFEDLGAHIYAPALMGQAVYDQILQVRDKLKPRESN
jgi:hypothetical protein